VNDLREKFLRLLWRSYPVVAHLQSAGSDILEQQVVGLDHRSASGFKSNDDERVAPGCERIAASKYPTPIQNDVDTFGALLRKFACVGSPQNPASTRSTISPAPSLRWAKKYSGVS
jgi:hypothetical protein